MYCVLGRVGQRKWWVLLPADCVVILLVTRTFVVVACLLQSPVREEKVVYSIAILHKHKEPST